MKEHGPHCCGKAGAAFFLALGLFQLAKDMGFLNTNISIWALLFIALGLKMFVCCPSAK